MGPVVSKPVAHIPKMALKTHVRKNTQIIRHIIANTTTHSIESEFSNVCLLKFETPIESIMNE